jgi:hypothetical protein
MVRFAVLPALALCLGLPAFADTGRILSRDDFVQVVKDRALTRTGIRLVVSPDGKIDGRALGFKVTGSWDWRDGYFCREMQAGLEKIGYDCQLVERKGDALRFTSSKGKGDFADLRIR